METKETPKVEDVEINVLNQMKDTTELTMPPNMHELYDNEINIKCQKK